jgi:hypothetical protein
MTGRTVPKKLNAIDSGTPISFYVVPHSEEPTADEHQLDRAFEDEHHAK